MLGNSTCLDVENNENCNLCVIVTISKAHSSGRTSIIYCMKLNTVDIVDTVEGHPFRLSKPNFQYIWDNDEVTNENIQFGSVVKYTEIGQDYLYRGNTKRARIVSSSQGGVLPSNLPRSHFATRLIRYIHPCVVIQRHQTFRNRTQYNTCYVL